MSMCCPACGTISNVRTSRPLSVTVQEQYLKCSNPDCQCVFVSLTEAVRIVGYSLLPETEHPEGYRKLPVSHISKGRSTSTGIPKGWMKNPPD
jgi:hypothetical protein